MSIVTYEKDGAVGVVTLAKPPHNLIDEAFLDALLAAYGDADGASARKLGKLSHQRSDGATRRCDDYSLTRLGLSDNLHP